jgi:hypothetical protein
MILQEESRNELKSFLDTDEADAGLNDRSRQLVCIFSHLDCKAETFNHKSLIILFFQDIVSVPK